MTVASNNFDSRSTATRDEVAVVTLVEPVSLIVENIDNLVSSEIDPIIHGKLAHFKFPEP